jgi:hypothetical protein
MNLILEALLGRVWNRNNLSDSQWKWEFLRQSGQFRKDAALFLASDWPRFGFVDIWDLPHPGENSVTEYAYLPDFMELLFEIACRWIQEGKVLTQIEIDLLKFALALGGNGKPFYQGRHSLLLATTHSCTVQQRGRPVPRTKFITVVIRLPAALKNRSETILSMIETKGFTFAEDPKLEAFTLPGDGPVQLTPSLTRLRKFDGDKKYLWGSMLLKFKIVLPATRDVRQAESELSILLQEQLNEGLKPVLPMKRKKSDRLERNQIYSRHLEAVEAGEHAVRSNDPNDVRLGRAKVKTLEDNAAARRAILE